MMRFLRIRLFALVTGLLLLTTGCQQAPVTYEQKNFEAPAAQVSAVNLNVRDRKIQVLAAEDETVRLEYAESEKDFYNVALSEDGTLSVTIGDAKEWNDYFGAKAGAENRTIKLYVPQNSLESLTLSTTNEDLLLPALSVNGTADLTVNNGSIQLTALDAGKEICLEAKNGNITGTLAGAYEDFSITSRVKKGESNLPETKEAGAKLLQVSANNGDIALEFGGNA